MPSAPIARLGRFLAELKRRKVYRVTAIYLVLAFGGLELASAVLPATRLPEWFDELFLGIAIVGLPLVAVLAWTFDVTEGGILRTPDVVETSPRGSVPGPRGAGSHGERLDPLVVAVLPFENLSGAVEAEPFALGLHDDLLTELSRASALTVISRTSVRGYLGSSKPLPQIARELGAGTIVEGGVQQAGTRVRLNVQLIDAETDRHLWAERYDRDLTTENIFELQSELAAQVMKRLHATLTAEEQAAPHQLPTSDLEAYRLLVTAREALIDRSEAGFRRAEALCERALELDPDYALAWAVLSAAIIGLVDYGHTESRAGLARGAEACRRAVELAPALAEGYAALGQYRAAVRDAPGSARAHGRAIELRPSYAGAYQWSCWAELLLDRGREALEFGDQAVRLDPLDPEASGNLAMACLMVGEPERALGETRRILAHHPTFEYALWAQGLSLQALGRWEEAAGSFAPLRDRWTRGWPELGRATVAALAGDEDAVVAEGASLLGVETGFEQGMIRALLGDLDGALELIRTEWPLPWAETLYLYVRAGHATELLRTDARFGPLLEEVRRSWQAGQT
jgi:TolB-like protein